jgi:hypothetical protein
MSAAGNWSKKIEIFLSVGNDRMEMKSSANKSGGAGLPIRPVCRIIREETVGQWVKK